MLVLDKLWRGEISPSNTHVKRGSEYSKLLKDLGKREEAIQEELTEEGRDLFTDIQDLQIEQAHTQPEALCKGLLGFPC